MASLVKTIHLDYTCIASLLKLKSYRTTEYNQNECEEGNTPELSYEVYGWWPQRT